MLTHEQLRAKNEYRDFVESIASCVRQNQFTVEGFNFVDRYSDEFTTMLGSLGDDEVEGLKTYFKNPPEKFIIDFDGNNKLLVARFYSDRYSEYIEIPVLIVNTKFTGKYTGKINTINKSHFTIKHDDSDPEFMSLEQALLANPGMHVFPQIGVVTYVPDELDRMHDNGEINEYAYRWLTNKNKNGYTINGNVVVMFTDEANFLKDSPFEQPDKGVLKTKYSYGHTFAHKPLVTQEVLAFVWGIHG